MKKSIYLSVTLLFLSGCGGGGSSESLQTRSISGVVGYPEILGADVSMVCGKDKFYANRLTNKDGQFTILNINNSISLDSCVLESTNGKAGGFDFKNTTLKSNLSLNKLDKVIISPITTFIANHEGADKNITLALDKTAKFFNVLKDELKNKPNDKLQKISSKLALIALTKDRDGKPLGFDFINAQDKFNANMLVDNAKNISKNSKDTLKSSLKDIDNSTTKDEILNISVKHTNNLLLLSAYNLNHDDLNYNIYKNNMEKFATKMANSLKIEDTSYTFPNRYTTRKAMSDANITPSFDTNNTLNKQLYEKITSSNFVSNLSKINLNIKDIKGITLYDICSYKNILGNDNDKRIEYYTFSNISHIGEAIKVAQTSYDDLVLDPIYQKVSNGYIKLGFFDEAIEVASENIYSDSIKIETLVQLSTKLIKSKKDNLSKNGLNLAFTSFKKYANSIGVENLSDKDMESLVGIFYGYYTLKDKEKYQEALNLVSKPIKNSPTLYKAFMGSYIKLIHEAIIEKDQNRAKELFDINYPYALDTPTLDSNEKDLSKLQISEKLFFMIEVSSLLKKADKGKTLLDRANNIIQSTSNPFYKSMFDDQILAFEALKDDEGYTKVLEKFDSLDTKIKSGILRHGLVTAMVMHNDTDKAINYLTEYYPNAGSKWIKPSILVYYVDKIAVGYNLDTSIELSFLDESKQKEFLKALFDDTKNISKEAWKKEDPYRQYFKHFGMKEIGYPVMIRHFNNLNDNNMINKVVNESINLIDTNMTLISDKITSYQVLFDVLSEINYKDTTLLNNIITSVEKLIPQLDLKPTKRGFSSQIVALNSAIKYLSKYNQLQTSKKIIEKIDTTISQIDTLSIKNVKMKADIILGRLIGDTDYFYESFIGALISAKEEQKALKLINELKSNIDSFGDSLDSNSLKINLAKAYAAINRQKLAQEMIETINTIKEKNLAKLFVSEYISSYDSFPSTNVASIDTDQDGKPDFFNKFATQEEIEKSGLTLDDDIDGDGTTDDKDELPYCKTR